MSTTEVITIATAAVGSITTTAVFLGRFLGKLLAKRTEETKREMIIDGFIEKVKEHEIEIKSIEELRSRFRLMEYKLGIDEKNNH